MIRKTGAMIFALAAMGGAMFASTALAQDTKISLQAKGVTVGYTSPSLDNDYWVKAKGFMEKTAAELGINLVVAPATTGDVSSQLDILNQFAAQKVDAVVVAAVDSKGVVPGIEMLNQANIPVVSVDSLVGGGDVIAKVATNGYRGGELLGEYVYSVKGEGGTLFQEQTDVFMEIAEDRVSGTAEVLKQHGWKVLGQPLIPYGRGPSRDLAQAALVANPEITAINARNDDTALGVVAAAQALGRNDVMILGYDALPDALDAIEAGTMAATVFQDQDLMYGFALRIAALYLGAPWTGTVEYQIPPILVTKDNVADIRARQ